MAHSYRKLQHWNQWLAQQFLGSSLLESEYQCLSKLLSRYFGKHALLIGVPEQYSLLSATSLPCHSLITPLMMSDKKTAFIESDLHDLPILTGSIDLVVIPHTLEFIDNPRQLLSEACRIVKAQGLIIIAGFNPYSFWGLKQKLSKQKEIPWSGNFYHSYQIKTWLRLADFVMENHSSLLFRPPIKQAGLYKNLQFLEKIGRFISPFAGIYMLAARAQVTPLTPIRLKWKQRLSDIRISSTISGHIARYSEQIIDKK